GLDQELRHRATALLRPVPEPAAQLGALLALLPELLRRPLRRVAAVAEPRRAGRPGTGPHRPETTVAAPRELRRPGRAGRLGVRFRRLLDDRLRRRLRRCGRSEGRRWQRTLLR